MQAAHFSNRSCGPEKDKAFLIHFDHEVELLQDLTSSRERLEKALDDIDRPQWKDAGDQSGGSQNGGSPDSRSRHRRGMGGGGTTLYDAVYLASHDLMSPQSGRKALILLTDGEDRGSKVSLHEAIDSTQRADTLAYAVRIADEEQMNRGFGSPGMGRRGGMGGGGWGGRGGGPYGRGPSESRPDGKKVLQQISKETGGDYFDVTKKKTVDQIYSRIEEDLRNQYSIGYTPDRPATDAGFRRIQLTVKHKGLIVQAREGYYPGTKGKSS